MRLIGCRLKGGPAALAAVAVFQSGSFAHAQSTWLPTSGTVPWTTGTAWSGGSIPTSTGALAVFPNAALGASVLTTRSPTSRSRVRAVRACIAPRRCRFFTCITVERASQVMPCGYGAARRASLPVGAGFFTCITVQRASQVGNLRLRGRPACIAPRRCRFLYLHHRRACIAGNALRLRGRPACIAPP